MTTTTILHPTHAAFDKDCCIARGSLAEVAIAVAHAQASGRHGILIFDNASGEQIDLNLRGSDDEIRERLAATHPEAPPAPVDVPPDTPAAPRGPGRPRLGVVAREITLLPRHWEWLSQQQGGASVTLRKLVDDARHAHAMQDQVRRAQDAACRFLTVTAGNRPGFEEAVRALYARDAASFAALTQPWPEDVREHARTLAAPALREASQS